MLAILIAGAGLCLQALRGSETLRLSLRSPPGQDHAFFLQIRLHFAPLLVSCMQVHRNRKLRGSQDRLDFRCWISPESFGVTASWFIENFLVGLERRCWFGGMLGERFPTVSEPNHLKLRQLLGYGRLQASERLWLTVVHTVWMLTYEIRKRSAK